jgi:hypothetical protein
MDPVTGLISGVPTKNGTFNVTVTAMDSRGASASVVFSWSISKKATSPAPTVNLAASPSSVSLGGSSTLSWSSTNATSCLAGGGWSGAKTTSGSELRGPLSGTTSFTLTCTGDGGSTSRSVTVSVAAEAPPSIVTPAAQSGAIGQAANLQMSATDPNGDVLTYSASGLPTGLGINPQTGLISGTYQAAGVWNVVVTVANDKGESASAVFAWTVAGTANSPPVVMNPGAQDRLNGQVVSLQIQATDFDNDPLSYAANVLPTGLVINAATGLISGTVTGNGKTTTTVTVSDGRGGVASVTFTWTIRRR